LTWGKLSYCQLETDFWTVRNKGKPTPTPSAPFFPGSTSLLNSQLSHLLLSQNHRMVVHPEKCRAGGE